MPFTGFVYKKCGYCLCHLDIKFGDPSNIFYYYNLPKKSGGGAFIYYYCSKLHKHSHIFILTDYGPF